MLRYGLVVVAVGSSPLPQVYQAARISKIDFGAMAANIPKPSCAPHLLPRPKVTSDFASATEHGAPSPVLQSMAPVAGLGTPAVDIGELLRWNGVGEPILLRELMSESERLMVLSEIGIAPTRRHPDEFQKIWIDTGKMFSNNHCSKRQTFLSKIFGRTGTKNRFDDYLLTGELPSLIGRNRSVSASPADHGSKRRRANV